MTFKKILGLLTLACLTVIGLSACTPEKEPTWTYDKNKMLFTGQDASVQVLSATKIESPEGQKAVRACTIRLLNLGHAKYEKVAIYEVNQRISNIWRIAGAA